MPRAITLIQTEERGLVREMDSKALLSTDRDALQRSRNNRQTAQDNRRLRSEVCALRSVCETFEQKLKEITETLETLTAR